MADTPPDLLTSIAEIDADKLVCDLSHELRTVLGGVIGINELLMASELDPQQRQLSQVIERSAKILLSVLDDTVTLARLNQKANQVDQHPFDLRKTILEVKEQLNYLLEARKITLQTDTQTLPPLVVGDSAAIKQILFILMLRLINAVEKTKVALCVKLEPGQGEVGELLIAVSTEPVGVFDERHLSTLNEPMRADRRYDSAWISLYLCHRLVGLLRGTCGADFAPTRCTLWSRLPLSSPPS